ncbi:MAG: aminomethyl-transferring glycine dehydrogenase subunit GcvPA [Candidatus Saganbacteria bacterium]|nr:aminomethyl-transferring glycine dehydrogenase subunit GcvPA [Candidatus Saganbacteria bacterium]
MRYVPHSSSDRTALLSACGLPGMDDLFADTPAKARLKMPLAIPEGISEPELLAELSGLAQKNSASSWLGGGSDDHFIPAALKHIISRSEFYTAYTPYQAEASQGTLQSIYEYQSMICELTGMDAANASMYDGATALAEAALLATRVTGRKEIVVSAAVHPNHRAVLKTYAQAAGLTVKEVAFDPKIGQTTDSLALGTASACYVLQQPNFFGCLEPVNGLAGKASCAGALFIVSVDPISLGLLKAPGDYGADIVVGEGQSLGNPRSFGGPGLGLFAVKDRLVRQIPGRLSGLTVDKNGQRGFCLTLQTREQHIRRERAPSNICSNEALAALAAVVYLSLMGKQGLRQVAALCLQKAHYLKKKLGKKVVFSSPSFKEFVVKSEKPVGLDLNRFYPELKGCRLICVTELTDKTALDRLAGEL